LYDGGWIDGEEEVRQFDAYCMLGWWWIDGEEEVRL